ncbi:MAG: tRNA (guanine-N7-)-methyltransferase [Rickettsiales bacterium]|jgi:tRNA (guanine-N7-)-methyltransferase
MTQEFKFIRSFGRIKSRKLGQNRVDLFNNILPKYQFEVDNLIKNNKFSKINLEIGFGSGDFLFENAKNNPDQLFIGSEIYINSIGNLLTKLEKNPLNNVKIYQNDVRFLLEKLPNNFLDRVFILFPDPWPKKRHHNRRIVNQDLLKILHFISKPKSKLLIATDHQSYQEHLLKLFTNNVFFTLDQNFNQNPYQEPDFWIKTKYQKKAITEGRESMFFNLLI